MCNQLKIVVKTKSLELYKIYLFVICSQRKYNAIRFRDFITFYLFIKRNSTKGMAYLKEKNPQELDWPPIQDNLFFS